MQALVLFTSLTVAYTIRAQLSVSMVAMTGHSVHEDGRNKSIDTISNETNCNSRTTGGWTVYRVSSSINIRRVVIVKVCFFMT